MLLFKPQLPLPVCDLTCTPGLFPSYLILVKCTKLLIQGHAYNNVPRHRLHLHLCKIYTALLLTGYIYRHIQKRKKRHMWHTETSTTALIYNFAFALTSSSWGFVRLSAAALSLSTRLRILPLADLGMDLEGGIDSDVSTPIEHVLLNNEVSKRATIVSWQPFS